MRIILTHGAAPRLEAAADFRRFSVALDPVLDSNRDVAVAPLGALADADHVWVRPDAVRALSPLAGQPDWEASFANMLAFADKSGWIDPMGRIRAHIEHVETPGPIDADTFRQAMRRFASGVCIVATGNGDARCGMTVSAFSSVSAEPPLVLVCLNRDSAAHGPLTTARTYSINILEAGQSEEAMLFAGQRGLFGADRFGRDWVAGAHAAPTLKTALHSLVCTSAAQHEAGTHTILIGRVISAVAGREGAALVNFEGTLGKLDRAA